MAVPKSRHTSSKKRRRRSHIHLRVPSLSLCPKCGKNVLPHTVCKSCGYYKGKMAINVLEKLEKKQRKQKEKEMEQVEKEKVLDPKKLSK